MLVRALIIAAIAVVLSLEIARLTVAAAEVDSDPALSKRLAPDSPPALVAVAMADVGKAAAAGSDPSPLTMDRLRRLAIVAPLHPEPFLVHAALAERKGAFDKAEKLLEQARDREPRSAAARYLLADVRLRQGKVVAGLSEMAVLTRLLPAAKVQLLPALSQYAHLPGGREKLAGILATNPQLRQPLLQALAADPENAALILALAGGDLDPRQRGTRQWETRLLGGLVERGDYEQAYGLWRRFAGIPEGVRPLIFNGDFKDLAAPPPFNWTFSASSAGVADAENGQLRVLYYGRDDAPLAAELLLLPPGRYRFGAPVSGQLASGSLQWVLACLGGAKLLESAAESAGGVTFTVPASGCPAQMLGLAGKSQDMPQDSDARIGPVRIEELRG